MNKFLTESGWKAILQQNKGKVKDNGLQRALATYEKLPEAKYPERQKALEQIFKLGLALNSAKGTKDIESVADYLSEVCAAAVKEGEQIEKDKKAAAVPAVDKNAAPVATVKTPYGGLAYFSNDKANAAVIERLEKTVVTLAGAQDDVKGMKMAVLEAAKLKKKIPPKNEIMASLKKADRQSSSDARQAKAAFLIFDEFQGKVRDLNEDAENAAKAAKAALMEMDADTLEEKAKELRKRAEEANSAIEKLLKGFTTALKVVMAVTSPEPLSKLEVISTVAETFESAFSMFKGSGSLVQQAEENEKMAHDLKLGAAEARLSQTKEHLQALQRRLGEAVVLYQRAKALAKMTGSAPMKGFDKNSQAAFRFEDLETYANRLAEACDLAMDAIKESKLVFDVSDVTMGVVVAGKWKVPQPDESKKILQKMKDEAVKLGKGAGETYKGANLLRIEAQKLYAEAQEALAMANT